MQSPPEYVFPRTVRTVTMGRDPASDVPLRGIGVSRIHALIRISEESVLIEDCRSTFGTRVDGNPVDTAALCDGAVITAGVAKFRVRIDKQNVTLSPFREAESAPEKTLYDRASSEVVIGRDPSSTICLPHPLVSRFHATFRSGAGKACSVEDHGSTNGTFVNGKAVRASEA